MVFSRLLRRRCRRSRRHNKRKGLEGSRPPTYTSVDRTKCPLLKAISERNWARVERRCRSHPEEAFCWSKKTHRTALHFVTSPDVHCPLHILELLIETNPHAVLLQDSYRYVSGTPLHHICSTENVNDPRVVQLFVDTALKVHDRFPSIEKRPSHWSPLYVAARQAAPVEALQLLLKTRQETRWIAPWTGGETFQDMNGSTLVPERQSPLECLWAYCDFSNLDSEAQNSMREIAIDMLQPQCDSIPSSDDSRVARWIQCLLLLRECCQDSTRVVRHVACLYHPIPGLLQFVCELFPEQACMKDEHGRLPLHDMIVHTKFNNRKWQQTLLHADLEQEREKEILVQMVSTLVDANPDALAVAEPESDLHPYLLAAVQDYPLESIYYMLNKSPQVMMCQREGGSTRC